MTDYEKLYKEFKSSNPDTPLGFSKFKSDLRLKAKQEKHEKSRDLIAKKLVYWKNKCERLKDEIEQLKASHQLTIKQLKKDRVVVKKIQNVTKIECDGCKSLRRMIEKPLDAKGERVLELMKYLISLRSVLYDEGQVLSESDTVLLCFAYLNQYFTRRDLYETFNFSYTYSFKLTVKLRKLGLISNMSDTYLSGKKQNSKYFLTIRGNECLMSILNKLGRRSLKLDGTYNRIEEKKKNNRI